ncbi:hypothetical protein PtrSN002B_003501 [Pyrenophora tritici-repentis]|uniref:Uncharacterized protein n=2 Tax=Pyrenophora tritici-repentis TaxID=45151 RepID=A0A2W1DDP8_9PLEO|nr:uncharacterized protein PTRG_04824 [Pyrenophora tritici-repentis Pt-1C-BFP]KAA8612398.1 hypothetical protein PtrV1_12967 [Pyrenophora tritici-repentis]EDU47731.1 predicted protein [Pyrenophora tritici-repentis Pt-1C-BFP]KAF7447075.1 hypothetical protein A1F99_085220 [Pyrenophora tritici-repentis]KAF7569366.1 hypothetical protein PtrM4_117810 [Pyrenophora tritici-repentis]KAG9382860.1 hypothetical protein A1F94_006781 [Pyrenophora tritici-repentis]
MHPPAASPDEANVSYFFSAMHALAVTVSRFEIDTLHIPPSLSFFTVNARDEKAFMEGVMFFAALMNSFVTIPLLDWLGDRYYPKPRPRYWIRSFGWYSLFFVTFYVINVTGRFGNGCEGLRAAGHVC